MLSLRSILLGSYKAPASIRKAIAPRPEAYRFADSAYYLSPLGRIAQLQQY